MKISQTTKKKIEEQILACLFSKSPKPLFTSEIAEELARDEEFTKSLLSNLKKNNLVVEVKKNPKGKDYLKRSRWGLSEPTYLSYKKLSEIK